MAKFIPQTKNTQGIRVQSESSVDGVAVFYNIKEEQYWVSVLFYESLDMVTHEVCVFTYEQSEQGMAYKKGEELAHALQVPLLKLQPREVWR